MRAFSPGMPAVVNHCRSNFPARKLACTTKSLHNDVVSVYSMFEDVVEGKTSQTCAFFVRPAGCSCVGSG